MGFKRLCIVSFVLIALTYMMDYILKFDASRGEFIEYQYIEHHAFILMFRLFSLFLLVVGLIGILVLKFRSRR